MWGWDLLGDGVGRGVREESSEPVAVGKEHHQWRVTQGRQGEQFTLTYSVTITG